MTNQKIVDAVLELLDVLNAGDATAAELREKARALPGNQGGALLPWIDLAEFLHEAPRQPKAPAVTVKSPRFRKGTGNQPAAWADCLWQPPRFRP